MKFHVEWDNERRFRIVSDIDGKVGSWATYESIARMDWNGVSLFAVSSYFDGTFLPEKVYIAALAEKVK